MKTILIDQQNEILTSLSKMLIQWQNSQGLDNICANEQSKSELISEEQELWLISFLRMWDLTVEMELK